VTLRFVRPLLLSKHPGPIALALTYRTAPLDDGPFASDTWVQWLASSRVLPAAPASLHASFESVSCWPKVLAL